MYARTLNGPEKQPNYVNFFCTDDIQLQIQVAPGGDTVKYEGPITCSTFFIQK